MKKVVEKFLELKLQSNWNSVCRVCSTEVENRRPNSILFLFCQHPETTEHFSFLWRVSIKSVCTYRPFRDFKVQLWLQGWKLSIPVTSLDRPGGQQIKSLKPKQQRHLSPGLRLCVGVGSDQCVFTLPQRVSDNLNFHDGWAFAHPSMLMWCRLGQGALVEETLRTCPPASLTPPPCWL